MKHIPLVNLKAQYKLLKPEINKTIKRVLETTDFINGTDNQLFDLEFAKYCEAKYSIGVGSGSVALDFSLEALGLQKGDEVICPSHTFSATAEPIVRLGGKPVFADINEQTYNIDPEDIAKKISRRTVGIIAVHLYGHPADMSPILKLASEHNLWVVEDAAQSHGAEYQGKRIGSIGDIACFSFFPAKNLGCYGDGGAIVTNISHLNNKVSLLKDHGRIGKYEHKEIGYGGRLDNLQAAILRIKLRYLDQWNAQRRIIAEKYTTELTSKFVTPTAQKNCLPVYYVYTLRHPQRDNVIRHLYKNNIASGIYYPKPLHLQEAYKFLGYKKGDLPKTEQICDQIFSIPMHPELTDKQIEKTITSLLKF